MVKSFRQVLSEAKKEIDEISVHELKKRLSSDSPPVLLDVRERDEYEAGHITGAIFLPRGFLEFRVEDTVPSRDTPIALQCAGGNRSALAVKTLHDMGYSNVLNVTGGFTAWRQAGYDYEVTKRIGEKRSSRYSRHLIIPEIGEEGQRKLLESKVLIIGAGGLGSPSGYYLAAAGVGTIGIVDFDVVDESNLQRQILHNTLDIGRPKTDSARETLKALNPDVTVVPYQTRITSDNVFEIIKDYQIIVNGCDNFPTRYLLNDACYMEGKPIVDGSIFRFEGQATVFVPDQGPCYRCLYPEPPPPDMAPSCDEAGVLGILPGIVGTIQANETVKLLLGKGEPLVGRLLLFDALKMTFRELKTKRDPRCPLCGENPTIRELIDYEGFCAGTAHGS